MTTPRCRECGMDGTPVDTITGMTVWHHEDPAVEDRHDFEGYGPGSGRAKRGKVEK